jgi:hypothetical protein
MADVHMAIGLAALALAIVGAAWSAVLSVRRRAGGRAYLGGLGAVVLVALAAALLGLLLLATGSAPADPLHLVYGVVAVVALPLAAAFAAGRRPRSQSLALLLGAAVEIGVIVRLFQTG